MAIKFSNNISTSLSAAINATDTSISLASATGLPSLGTGDYFYLTIDTDTASPTIEVVKVTAVSGTTLTVTRGQDGTTASAFDAGTKVELRVTAAALDDLAQAADTESVSISGDTMTGNLTVPNLSVTSTNWLGFGDYGERITGSNAASTLSFYTNSTQALQLDSSQNATFAGAITSSGLMTVTADWTAYYGSINISHSQNTLGGLGLRANGVYKGGLIYRDGTQGAYWELNSYESESLKFKTNNTVALTLDSSQNATFAGTISSGAITSTGTSTFGGVQIGGTTVISSSRNLTNIGTISSGAITSSGQFLSKVITYAASQSAVYMTAASTSYTGASTNWGTHGAKHYIKTDSGGVPRITVDWEGGEKYSLTNSGNATFAGNVGAASGHVSGKFAVKSSSVHGTYDLYNNGTTYFNGATIIDDVLDITGTNASLKMTGTEVIDKNRILKNILRADFGNFTVTGTSTTEHSYIRNTMLSHAVEGDHVTHPYFFNDLANFEARGGTVTVAGLDFTPSFTNVFKANPSFASWADTNYTGSTMTITLTSMPKTLSYTGFIGISFGNTSWMPESCKIEISTDGGTNWTTRLDNSSAQVSYFTTTGAGSTAVNAIRFTLGQSNGSAIRLTNIWAYNYNSNGMEDYFLSKGGGTVYGDIATSGTISSGDITVSKGGTAGTDYPKLTLTNSIESSAWSIGHTLGEIQFYNSDAQNAGPTAVIRNVNSNPDNQTTLYGNLEFLTTDPFDLDAVTSIMNVGITEGSRPSVYIGVEGPSYISNHEHGLGNLVIASSAGIAPSNSTSMIYQFAPTIRLEHMSDHNDWDSGDVIGQILFGANDHTTNDEVRARIIVEQDTDNQLTTDSRIVFETAAVDASTSEVLRLDSSKNATFAGTISSGAITTTGLLHLDRSTSTASSSTGTTFLKIDNYVGSDLSQQKSFIDFIFLDDNTNEIPQVRIGAEVGQNGDANSQEKEGSGAFVVYTNNAESTSGDAGTSLAERFRVDYAGNATFSSDISAAGNLSAARIISTITSSVGVKTTYGQFAQFATDSQIDLVSTSDGTWGSAINFVEGNNTSNTDVWSIARKTTGGAGDSSLNFNFGTSNDHANTTRVAFSSSGDGTFAGNLLAGDASDISMSSSTAGQLQVLGNGYTGGFALDASAMHIYHNSSLRDLILGTNETARITIDGNGGATVFSTPVTFSGGKVITGQNEIAHSQHTGWKLTATDDTAGASFYAMYLDHNMSGDTEFTGDFDHVGLFIDVDSSAQGGGTSHEHRVYGIYNDVRVTGDSDLVRGTYSLARADDFGSGQISNIYGADNQGVAHNNDGYVAAVYGARNYAQDSTDTSGDVGNIVGALNIAYLGSSSTVDTPAAFGSWNIVQVSAAQNNTSSNYISNVYGTMSEIQIDNDTSTNTKYISNVYGVYSVYDENDADDTYITVTNSYLFYGDYQATLNPTNAWGLYLVDTDVPSYIAGQLRMGTTDRDAGEPSYSFSGDPDTGMYSVNANVLGFSTGGTNRLTITSSGLFTQDLTYDNRGAFNSSNDTGQIILGAYNGPADGTGTSQGPAIVWKPNYSGYTKESLKIAGVATNNYFDMDMVFYTSGTSDSTGAISERFRLTQGGEAIFAGTISSGAITTSGHIQQNYNYELRGKDSNGAARTLLRTNDNKLQIGWSYAGDVEFIGGGSYTKRMAISGSTGDVSIVNDLSVSGTISSGAITSSDKVQSTKAQHASATSTNAHFRALPSATTDTTGLTSLFLGTSTLDGYGISLNGARKGTDGTPTFTLRTHYNSTSGSEVLSITNAGKATFGGAVDAAGGLELSNTNITEVNALYFADPGPGEGISWTNGNWAIYESPDDLTTNTAGNLQFVSGGNRKVTFNTSGDGYFAGAVTTNNEIIVDVPATTGAGTGPDTFALLFKNTDFNYTADALTAFNATTSWDMPDSTSFMASSRPGNSSIWAHMTEVNGPVVINRFIQLDDAATHGSGMVQNVFYQYDGAGTGTTDMKVPVGDLETWATYDGTNSVVEHVSITAAGFVHSKGYGIAGTTVIDSSRNLTNIGTISSGAITSSSTVTGSAVVVKRGTTYAQSTDYLYVGGNSLDSADAAIYIGNHGGGSGYGWRLYYHGTGGGNLNDLSIQSENLGSPVNVLRFNQDGAATFAGNISLNNDSAKFAAPVYRGTASSVSNSGYTTLFTVVGGLNGSSIKFNLTGTTGSVVVNVTADLVVGHYQDILITTQSGFYTTVTLKITTDDNEDFAVEATTNSANAVTLYIEVFPQSSETVTFTNAHSYTGSSLTHTCYYGTHTSGTGGNDGDLTVNGRTFLQDGIISSPALTFRNDHDTGLYRVGSDSLGWVVGGSRKFYTSSTRAYFQNLSEGVDVPSLRISGTEVIDSSRNISSGAISATTSGGSTTAPNVVLTIQANTSSTITTGGGTAIKFKGVSSGGNIQNYDQAMIASLGQASNNGHGLDFYVKPNASDELTKAVTITSGKVLNAVGGYQVNGTTVIDSSRNLTNIQNVSGPGSYTTDGSNSSGYGTIRIAHPKGADVYSRTGGQTGAIKITLPQSWTSTMMWFTIEVYEYSTNESFTVKVGGYNYGGSSSWINHTATIISNGNKDRNFTVRFAHDGSKCCIFIGDLDSTWSYPQVAVTEFIAGFNSATIGNWHDGWGASFETSSYGTVSGTHTQTDNNIHHTNIKINGTEVIDTSRNLRNIKLLGGDGSAGAPDMTFAGDTDTGFFRAADNKLGVACEGAEVARFIDPNALFHTNGGLQIGTTDVTISIDSSGSGINLLAGGLSTFNRAGAVVAAFNRTLSSSGTNGTGDLLFFNCQGSTVGKVTVTTSSASYSTASDQRLKENIVDAPSAGADIDAIQVRSFDWKTDGSHQKYGMVAQELLPTAPYAVSQGETEEDMMSVDYSKLVPMLVKEVQQLRARVAQQEAQALSLTKKIEELENDKDH